MQNPIVYVLLFCVSGAAMVALILELTRDETCYWREGAMEDGQYILYDEPQRVCEARGGGGSHRSRSLRRSSSSNSSGSWFRK